MGFAIKYAYAIVCHVTYLGIGSEQRLIFISSFHTNFHLVCNIWKGNIQWYRYNYGSALILMLIRYIPTDSRFICRFFSPVFSQTFAMAILVRSTYCTSLLCSSSFLSPFSIFSFPSYLSYFRKIYSVNFDLSTFFFHKHTHMSIRVWFRVIPSNRVNLIRTTNKTIKIFASFCCYFELRLDMWHCHVF